MAVIPKWKNFKNRSEKRQTTSSIVSSLDGLMNNPYEFGAMGLGLSKTDCLGMVRNYLYSLVDYVSPDEFDGISPVNYLQFCIDHREDYSVTLTKYLRHICYEVSSSEIRVGDIAVLSKEGEDDGAVGIICSPTSVMVCVEKMGTIMVSLDGFNVETCFRGVIAYGE